MDDLRHIDGRGVTALDGTTKARIERAALTLFAQGRMDKATTRAIAATAGISEGALYRHYASKEDIWQGLFFTLHERLGTLVAAAALSDDHISGQAAALVRAYCQTADDDWALFSFHLLSMHRFLQHDTPERMNPVTEAEKIVSTAMDRGQIAKGDAVLVAGMALGIVLQPALHKAYGRLHGNLETHADTLTTAVLNILTVTD
jgi:AcrR family transcriptional regulator